MTDEATEKVLDAIEKAIHAEVEGHYFYSMAARNTDDEKARAVFGRLAQDETHHAKYLEAQHEAIRTTGKTNRDVFLGDIPDFDEPHPIFSEKLIERIETAHYEMTALSVGASLELNAIEFYRKEAKAAPDPEVSAFFEKLAEWESTHYHALLEQQDALKGDYWGKGRFSPF